MTYLYDESLSLFAVGATSSFNARKERKNEKKKKGRRVIVSR